MNNYAFSYLNLYLIATLITAFYIADKMGGTYLIFGILGLALVLTHVFRSRYQMGPREFAYLSCFTLGIHAIMAIIAFLLQSSLVSIGFVIAQIPLFLYLTQTNDYPQ